MQIKGNKNCNIVVNGETIERKEIKRSKPVGFDEFNFQPMPKRFIVWDKKNLVFLTRPMEIWQIVTHFRDRLDDLFNENGDSRYIFCQSTNLFDKDGNEIFEGSIVRVGGETGIIQMVLGEWHAIGDDDIPLSVWKPSGIEMLGHILSNPELLEEK